jgi:hypothetical protein
VGKRGYSDLARKTVKPWCGSALIAIMMPHMETKQWRPKAIIDLI